MVGYELSYSILGKVADRLMVSRDLEKDIAKGLGKPKEMIEN